MEFALVAALLILVVVLLSPRPKALAVALVVSMFLTRFSFEVGSSNVRLEMIVAAGCLVALLGTVLNPERRSSLRLTTSTWMSVTLVFIWLIATFIATVAAAPKPATSLSVWAWCVLSTVSALWIATQPAVWRTVIKAGVAAVTICSALAIVFWGLATFAGLAEFGVQVDPAYGGFASYVFSLEANVLAGLICLWSLIAIYNPGQVVGPRLRVAAAALAPLAIFTTHTRAALVAFAVGAIVMLFTRRNSRRIVLIGGAAAVVIAPTILATGFDKGFSKFFQLFDTDTGTGGLRNRVNTVALDEWEKSHYWFSGLGWNSFGQRNYDLTQPELALPSYIGNLPVQILYDGGVLAVIIVTVSASLVLLKFARAGKLSLAIAIGAPYLMFSIATSALWFLETWLLVGLAWGFPHTKWARVLPDDDSPSPSSKSSVDLGAQR